MPTDRCIANFHCSKLVSVVITCYNYGRFLPVCIKSVLNQSYNDIEVLVINDGSTDNMDEVIKPFLDDERIKYIKQDNAGQANAKNTGIKQARGEFIAFLDADDKWDDVKLEKQILLFEDPKVGVVFSKACYIDENGNELDIKLLVEKLAHLVPKRGHVTDYLIFDNFVPFSSSVVRRECFNKLGFFDESLKMGIDWDLWLRISVHFEFDFVDESLFSYRMGHDDQLSKNIELRHYCCHLIMKKFFANNPGMISKSLMHRAFAYKYSNMGYYFRDVNRRKAIMYYMSALRHNCFEITAYKGLFVIFLRLFIPGFREQMSPTKMSLRRRHNK